MKVQSSKFKVQSLRNGFTLIESLVAIAVLMTGVSAAIFLITHTINEIARTKNQIIAAYLAQEGIEVVRNIRDRNWMAARVWTTSIDALSDACVQWDTDYNNIDVSCASGLYLSFFGTPPHYAPTVAPTQFKRTINTVFTPAGIDPERLKVTSTVTCAANCSVSLEEYLYNWK